MQRKWASFDVKCFAVGAALSYIIIFSVMDIAHLLNVPTYMYHPFWLVWGTIISSFILGQVIYLIAQLIFNWQAPHHDIFWNYSKDLQTQILQQFQLLYGTSFALETKLPKYRQAERKRVHVIQHCLPSIQKTASNYEKAQTQISFYYSFSLLLFIALALYILSCLHPAGAFVHSDFWIHMIVIAGGLAVSALSIHRAKQLKREAEHLVYVEFLQIRKNGYFRKKTTDCKPSCQQKLIRPLKY